MWVRVGWACFVADRAFIYGRSHCHRAVTTIFFIYYTLEVLNTYCLFHHALVFIHRFISTITYRPIIPIQSLFIYVSFYLIYEPSTYIRCGTLHTPNYGTNYWHSPGRGTRPQICQLNSNLEL